MINQLDTFIEFHLLFTTFEDIPLHYKVFVKDTSGIIGGLSLLLLLDQTLMCLLLDCLNALILDVFVDLGTLLLSLREVQKRRVNLASLLQ